MSGAMGVASSVSQILDDIWGNIFAGMQMKQQGEQFREQMDLQKERFGLEQDQFQLSKMLQEQGMYNQAEDRSWKRNFQRALGGLNR